MKALVVFCYLLCSWLTSVKTRVLTYGVGILLPCVFIILMYSFLKVFFFLSLICFCLFCLLLLLSYMHNLFL